MNIGSYSNQKLDSAQVAGPRGFHQRRTASFRSMLQVCTVLQQQLSYIRMPVFASVRQGGITSSSLGVGIGTGF